MRSPISPEIAHVNLGLWDFTTTEGLLYGQSAEDGGRRLQETMSTRLLFDPLMVEHQAGGGHDTMRRKR